MKHTRRGSGILLHISSLPSPYGIGTFGEEAYRFVDFLEKAGQSYWQILPLGQTSYGDSPYQSFSIDAGNPYFIDLDLLAEEGLLSKEDYISLDFGKNKEEVDYEKLYRHRYALLYQAYENFPQDDLAYREFMTTENAWLNDYALFMALKEEHQGKSWNLWKDTFKYRNSSALQHYQDANWKKVDFWKFLQFQFMKQWMALKDYANERGISIIGDLPIYVAYDSVDVWKNPNYFQLDEKAELRSVAGCPPDAFSETGQLWGNPLYDWHKMESNGYEWWISRMKRASLLYDSIRIDHFRGFESYYSIPATAETAILGQWEKGPGMKLFSKIKEDLGELDIIAEDLGLLTPEVYKLLEETGFPGMKVLQFAFESREGGDYLPHNYKENSIAYLGTHDNTTTMAWLKQASKEEIAYIKEYFNFGDKKRESLAWKLICQCLASVSRIAMIPMQDYLLLGEEARMNHPSTLGKNWTWRMKEEGLSESLCPKIYQITKLYQRLPKRSILENKEKKD